MWWADGVLSGRSSRTVGVPDLTNQLEQVLNRKTANADGGPAAGMILKKVRKQLVAEHERAER